MKPLISVIIPCLNEERHIGECLAAVRRHTLHSETIVVDGGSQDNTIDIARSYGAKVICTRPSRGEQLNLGAQNASGEYLLFLHGDSVLPPHWDLDVKRCLEEEGILLGAFSLKIDGGQLVYRFIERMVQLRCTLLSMPYGDQGLFLKRKDFFRKLNGFKNYPLMEDFDLVRRAKGLGRIAIVPSKITTSSRRWQQNGVLWTSLLNQAMVLGFLLGISPQKLATVYYRRK